MAEQILRIKDDLGNTHDLAIELDTQAGIFALRTRDPDAEAKLEAIHAQLNDATADTVISVLKGILIELASKVEPGQAIALDSTTLAALETINANVSGTVAVSNFPATQQVAGTVAVSNPTANPETGLAKEATLQSILGQLDDVSEDTVLSVLKALLVELGEKLEPNQGVKLMVGAQEVTTSSPLPVDIGANLSVTAEFKSVVSTLNSRTTPLAAGEVFVGGWEAVTDYAAIVAAVFTDQPSAQDGAVIQFSVDGTDPGIVYQHSATVPANVPLYFSFPPSAAYFRIIYTNGPTAQSFLLNQISYHFNAVQIPMDALGGQFDDSDVAAQVKAAINAKIRSGPYAGLYIPPTVNDTGELHVQDPVADAALASIRDRDLVKPASGVISVIQTDGVVATPSVGKAIQYLSFHLHLDPEAGNYNVVTLKVGASTIFVDKFEAGLPFMKTVNLDTSIITADAPVTISTSTASPLYYNIWYREV